jgi:DUF1680 family protein
MWSWRLLLATGPARYADAMERLLYNAIAGALSIDGRNFFCANPLQVRAVHDGTGEYESCDRRPWFSCACCPPNLARLMASLHHYVATTDKHGLQLHLFAPARVTATLPGAGEVRLEMVTSYPWDGSVELTVDGHEAEWELSLRVPAWSLGPSVTVDCVAFDGGPDTLGYFRVRRRWAGRSRVTLELPMPADLVRTNPRVDAVRGCVAMVRDPLVYCVEQVDQVVNVDDLHLDTSTAVGLAGPVVELGAPVSLVATGYASPPGTDALYYVDGPLRHGAARDVRERTVPITAVPYFSWANRGSNAMRVWLPAG